MAASTTNASAVATGVSRSGRVRKKSFKLVDYALTDEINALFNWQADVPKKSAKRMKFGLSTVPEVRSTSFTYLDDEFIDVKDEPLEVESWADNGDHFPDVCIKEEEDIKDPLQLASHFMSLEDIPTSQPQTVMFCYESPQVESMQPSPPPADPPSTGTAVSEGFQCGGPSSSVPDITDLMPPGYSDPPPLSDTYDQISGDRSPTPEDWKSDSDQEAAQSTEESDTENYSSDELFNSDFAASDQEYTDTSEASGDDETKSDPGEVDIQCKWVSGGSFDPQVFDFDASNSGIKANSGIDSKSTELDIFLKFFDSSLVDLIVRESNMYYTQLINTKKFPATSIMNKWRNTNRNEIYTFLALVMLMAYTKQHRIRNYWTKDPLFEIPMFRKVMPQHRFCLLLKMLNFVNSSGDTQGDRLHSSGDTQGDSLHSSGDTQGDRLHGTGETQCDSLHKVRSIYSMLKIRFGQLFQPFQNLMIDGRLMMWKGRQSFKRYIPKCHGSGVQLFVLCDCETEYILDFIAYTGANSEVVRCEKLGLSGAVVQTLMQTYLGKGHNLYLDSWCSSLKLFGYLRENKTGACGLVRTEKKCMPVFNAKMKKGECQSFHANNILALKWCGNRDMRLLSTVHEVVKVDSRIKVGKLKGQKLKKPRAVLDYITNVRQIDKCHLRSSSVDCVMKKAKWHIKLFFHLLDMVVLNTYTLYQVATGKTPVFTDFQLRLIRQVLQAFMRTQPHGRLKMPCGTNRTTFPLRLTSRHFPRSLPLTKMKKRYSKRGCVLCRTTTRAPRQRRETRFYCEECRVALCLVPCFEEYHTLRVL
ncbi:piggyBac transposable element-derived protein 4 [Procambarus clarkii]|uniref:piggyBac transposable element-derived protein 4 n=1 Tax=Procambarus clarkii TaxID=6728 RepID=UPI0037431362